MPELPEVETVARELRAAIIGKRIAGLQVTWAKTFVNTLSELPTGRKIESVTRKGKYLICHLDENALIVHLRMTGQLLISPSLVKVGDKHVHVIVQFSDGTELRFRDTRKFGRMYHVRDAGAYLKHVGIDALDKRLDFNRFYDILQNRRMNIKALLLNQAFISGLGNIYVDESLFRSGIHPQSLTSAIPRAAAQALFTQIGLVLRSAVDNMGSTISDYRTSYGNPGTNQHFFTVYRREGEPCLSCGADIIKIKVAGRGTHICRQCQILFN